MLEPGHDPARHDHASAEDAVVGPDTPLVDCAGGRRGAASSGPQATGAEIGAGAQVGPFTYLRPGTRARRSGAKAGAFVEIKNSQVGEGSKVPHLSYVGDATIGEGSNIGAATVFVNYDGVAKHRTVVGDHVRIGATPCSSRPSRSGTAPTRPPAR